MEQQEKIDILRSGAERSGKYAHLLTADLKWLLDIIDPQDPEPVDGDREEETEDESLPG